MQAKLLGTFYILFSNHIEEHKERQREAEAKFRIDPTLINVEQRQQQFDQEQKGLQSTLPG